MRPHRRYMRKKKADPYNEVDRERPAPIEILSRMAGRTNFLTPRTTASATNATPVTPLDIAHAIATASAGCKAPHRERVPNPLGASMAMAMACQWTHEWPKVEHLAMPRLCAELKGQRQMPNVIDGGLRFRARIALTDAFAELVHPTRLSWARRAKAWRMPTEIYAFVARKAESMLEESANTAAADAVHFLFARAITADPLASLFRFRSVVAMGDTIAFSPLAAEEVMELVPDCYALDIAELCLEVAQARQRRPGVLHLG